MIGEVHVSSGTVAWNVGITHRCIVKREREVKRGGTDPQYSVIAAFLIYHVVKIILTGGKGGEGEGGPVTNPYHSIPWGVRGYGLAVTVQLAPIFFPWYMVRTDRVVSFRGSV